METIYRHIADKYKSLFEYATANDSDVINEQTKQAIKYTTDTISGLFKELDKHTTVDASNFFGAIKSFGIDKQKKKVIVAGIESVDSFLKTAYDYITQNKKTIQFGKLQQAVIGSTKDTLVSSECKNLLQATNEALNVKNEKTSKKLTVDSFIGSVSVSLLNSINSETPLEYAKVKKLLADNIASYII
jgi:hypothetical protein